MQHRRTLLVLLLSFQAILPAFSWTRPTSMLRRSARRYSRAMSFASLQELAQRLIVQADPDPPLVCIVVAGGGGSAISTLASTEGASSLFLEGTLTYDQNAFHSYTNLPQKSADDEDFRYVSSEAAHLLSRAALERAMRYRPQLVDQIRCVGIGCTSSLVSCQSRPRPGRVSRGHIVASRADGTKWECSVTLASNKRSRFDEDVLMSQLVLKSLEQLQGKESDLSEFLEGDDQGDHWIHGDDGSIDVVEESARMIVEGSVGSVLLVPRKDNTFTALRKPTLPQGSLLFPGSFNPPHIGHITLANVAAAKWKESTACPAVLMELSVTNPDKPSIDPEMVSKRAHKFFELENLPENWGVLLSSAPLFSQKVDVFAQQIVTVDKESPNMAFVIGTDTMVRILDPKYYGNSEAAMLEAVFEMKRKGIHFIVGGRLENGRKESGKFVSGEDELERLPQDLQNMFTLLTEDEFRLDISSTELRTNQSSG